MGEENGAANSHSNDEQGKEKPIKDLMVDPSALSEVHPLVSQILVMCNGSITIAILTLYHMVLTSLTDAGYDNFSFDKKKMENAFKRRAIMYVDNGILNVKFLDSAKKIILAGGGTSIDDIKKIQANSRE
jgi:hypothetical protein